MDLQDYVDRDVAPVVASTGKFSETIKTSKGLPEMNIGKLDEHEEFQKLVDEPPNLTYK